MQLDDVNDTASVRGDGAPLPPDGGPQRDARLVLRRRALPRRRRRGRARPRADRAGRGDPRRRRRVDAPGRRAGRRRGGDRARRAGRRGARRAPGAQISIDTSKAAVAEPRSTPARASSTTSPRFRADPEMAALVAERGVDCCLMHMLGEPRTMQREPRYEDVVDGGQGVPRGAAGVRRRARGSPRSGSCSTRGSASARPSSTTSSCCAASASSRRLGRPLVIGTSRKSFLGRLAAREAAGAGSRRRRSALPGTIATNVIALERGASVFRVHDVAPVRDALAVAAATLGGRWIPEPRETTTPTS